jgi:hypothetical protein
MRYLVGQSVVVMPYRYSAWFKATVQAGPLRAGLYRVRTWDGYLHYVTSDRIRPVAQSHAN